MTERPRPGLRLLLIGALACWKYRTVLGALRHRPAVFDQEQGTGHRVGHAGRRDPLAPGAAHLARGSRALTAMARLAASQHSLPGRGKAAGATRNRRTEVRLRAHFPASALPAEDMGLCYTFSKRLVESSR